MASHTATGEWKSFEIRMRRRRAERLVLRADVAAEAGCFDDARELLGEARALWSAVPGLADVEQRIARGAAPVATPRAQLKWKEVTAAAAALLFVVAAVIVFGVAERTVLQQATSELPQVQSSTPRPAVVERGREAVAPIVDGAPTSASTSEIADTASPARAAERPASDVRPPISNSRPAAPDPAPQIPNVRPPTPDVLPATTSVSIPPAPIAVPTLTASSSAAIPPASNTAPLQPPQESLVNSVLARYAKAYSDLDVDAAERVWPTVNRSALTRAFDSLESQRVTLGECRVQVDGRAARATCTGSATWTPKVGGREHTDARSWMFDLERGAAGWQITSARVQNR